MTTMTDRLTKIRPHDLARMATVIQRCERQGIPYEVLKNGAIRVKQEGPAQYTPKGLTITHRCMIAHKKIRGA